LIVPRRSDAEPPVSDLVQHRQRCPAGAALMHVVLEQQRAAGAPRELTEACQRIWAMVEGVEGIRQVEAAVVERQVGTVIQHHLVHGARAAYDVHRHHVAREPALLEALGEPSVARAEVEGPLHGAVPSQHRGEDLQHPSLVGAHAIARMVSAGARGLYVSIGDSDDSYDFSDIARIMAPLDRGFDMVMGTRLKGQILPGAMSWSHRWIGNPILSGLLRLMFSTRISDSHCGMRSFTRAAYERMHLRTQGMEFASEMVVSALREGLRVQEI